MRLEETELAERIRKCSKCIIRKHVKAPVPGEGPSSAQVICVARNPGCVSFEQRVNKWAGKDAKYFSNRARKKNQVRMKEVVEEKYNGSLLSWDFEKNELVEGVIVKRFKSEGMKKKSQFFKKGDFINICFKNGNRLGITKDHKVWTIKNGWVRAGDLEEGDKCAGVGPVIDDVQHQILLGTILGDGSIQSYNKKKKSAFFSFGHSEKQKSYFDWKRKMLNNHISYVRSKRNRKDKGCFSDTLMWECCSSSDESYVKYLSCIDKNKVKRIREDWLEEMGPLAFAVLLMDDGSVSGWSGLDWVPLSTLNFPKGDVRLFANFMKKKYGFECFVNKRDERGGEARELAMDKGNHLRFLQWVSSYIPDCMSYKRLPGFEFNGISSKNKFGLVEREIEKIIEKEDGSCRGGSKTKYDVEIEKYHCYFADGILVSNSTENELGRPLVGSAGKLFDQILELIGLDRDCVGIVNTMKCFTPVPKLNRAPTEKELNKCKSWLKEELDFFSEKKIIIPFGAEAIRTFFKRDIGGPTKVAGKIFTSKKSSVAIIPMVHPAYPLRNPAARVELMNLIVPRVKLHLQNFL